MSFLSIRSTVWEPVRGQRLSMAQTLVSRLFTVSSVTRGRAGRGGLAVLGSPPGSARSAVLACGPIGGSDRELGDVIGHQPAALSVGAHGSCDGHPSTQQRARHPSAVGPARDRLQHSGESLSPSGPRRCLHEPIDVCSGSAHRRCIKPQLAHQPPQVRWAGVQIHEVPELLDLGVANSKHGSSRRYVLIQFDRINAEDQVGDLEGHDQRVDFSTGVRQGRVGHSSMDDDARVLRDLDVGRTPEVQLQVAVVVEQIGDEIKVEPVRNGFRSIRVARASGGRKRQSKERGWHRCGPR